MVQVMATCSTNTPQRAGWGCWRVTAPPARHQMSAEQPGLRQPRQKERQHPFAPSPPPCLEGEAAAAELRARLGGCALVHISQRCQAFH